MSFYNSLPDQSYHEFSEGVNVAHPWGVQRVCKIYFGQAAKGEIAKVFFEKFVAVLKKSGLKVETGVFGAKMEIEAVNDGPVTIILSEFPLNR